MNTFLIACLTLGGGSGEAPAPTGDPNVFLRSGSTEGVYSRSGASESVYGRPGAQDDVYHRS